MFCRRDEVGIEGPRSGRVRLAAGELIEEPRRKVLCRVRADRREASPDAGERRQRGGGECGQTAGLLEARRPPHAKARGVDRQCGPESVHRMHIPRHFAQGDPHRVGDTLRGQAGGCGPASRPQQLGDLGVRAAFDQVSDAVAAVKETPFAPSTKLGQSPSNNALEAGDVRTGHDHLRLHTKSVVTPVQGASHRLHRNIAPRILSALLAVTPTPWPEEKGRGSGL